MCTKTIFKIPPSNIVLFCRVLRPATCALNFFLKFRAVPEVCLTSSTIFGAIGIDNQHRPKKHLDIQPPMPRTEPLQREQELSLRDFYEESDSDSDDESSSGFGRTSRSSIFRGSVSPSHDKEAISIIEYTESPPKSPVRKGGRTPTQSPMKSPIRSPTRGESFRKAISKLHVPELISPKIVGANLRKSLKKTSSSARQLLSPKEKPKKTWQDDLHLPRNVTKEQAMAILLAQELSNIDI